MNESFEDRVKRLFGSSLCDSVPKRSFPTSSWSVAVGEVQRQEWIRDRGGRHEQEDDTCSWAFYDKGGSLFKNRRSKRDKQREFEGDLGDLGDDEAEEEEGDGERGGRYDEEREEEEIRSSVGLDPTLDNEDEEDEYDKSALCIENASERVYMKDVKDHGPGMNCHAVVPDLIDEPSDDTHHFNRDPRADNFAAGVRLNEDKSAAVSHPPLPLCKSTEPSSKLPVKISGNDVHIKPILKRKDAHVDPKPKKRVRFDPVYIDDHDEVAEGPQDVPMLPKSTESPASEESAGIPDYLMNPSKYTRYSFDSAEGSDEETNKRAFEDFWNLKRSKLGDLQPPEYPAELPKSIPFTPRKKSVDVVPMDDRPVKAKEQGEALGCRGSTAAGEANESDFSEMDEDDAEAPSARKGRQYRQKSMSDDSS